MRAVAEDLDGARAEAVPCAHLCGFRSRAGAAGVQAGWAATPVRERLRVLRRARHTLAGLATEIAAALSPTLARTSAETLVGELLPLLEACKFLEHEAEKLLRPRRLGLSGRPLWLSGVWAEVHREPLGEVLIIGPANVPLFLPGVQVLQALAAGNTVTWKPGAGGGAVAEIVTRTLREAGLPPGALTVTGEGVEAARTALESGPGKVVFTGSAENGRTVLAALARTSTPAVVELSGADAVVVLPSADLHVVARAVAFGLRWNGSAVCMSPRRLFATAATLTALRPLLAAALADVPAVGLEAQTAARLGPMLEAAAASGAVLRGQWQPAAQKPLLVDAARPAMEITRSDFFAPVLSLIEVETMLHVPELHAVCPYALTVAIFCGRGQESKARTMARVLKAGTVLINDIIVPTADPRVPFGGRGASGYGVTRGAEGLLEMTALKTLLLRRGGSLRHLDPAGERDTPLFAGMIAALHGHGRRQRWAAVRQMMSGLKNR